jgi:hypothetical protein
MNINIDDLKQLVKSCRFVARTHGDDDLFRVAYLVEALEDEELFKAINEDIQEETGKPLRLIENE